MILELLAWSAASSASSDAKDAKAELQNLKAQIQNGGSPLFIKITDHELVDEPTGFFTSKRVLKELSTDLIPVSNIRSVFSKDNGSYTVIKTFTDNRYYVKLSVDEVHELIRQAAISLLADLKKVT